MGRCDVGVSMIVVADIVVGAWTSVGGVGAQLYSHSCVDVSFSLDQTRIHRNCWCRSQLVQTTHSILGQMHESPLLKQQFGMCQTLFVAVKAWRAAVHAV